MHERVSITGSRLHQEEVTRSEMKGILQSLYDETVEEHGKEGDIQQWARTQVQDGVWVQSNDAEERNGYTN